MKKGLLVLCSVLFVLSSLNFTACRKESPAPKIKRVMPREVKADELSVMRLAGSGFQVNAMVFFDDVRSPGVMVEDDTKISMIVPKLKPGTVTIRLVNPDGKDVVVERAFRVTSPAAPGEIFPFTEAAEKMGVGGGDRDNDVGVVIGDYNNDGWDDILVAHQANLGLYMNNKGQEFIDVTEIAGLTIRRISHGAAWADFDNDGYLDLVLAHINPVILRNTGKGTFEDVSSNALIPIHEGAYLPVCADYDRDGYVDIFITGFSRPDMLLHNNGNLTFTSVFADLFKDDRFMSPAAAWGDYDNDGYPDIYVANVAKPSRLYHNVKGKGFEEVGSKAGVDNQRTAGGKDDVKYSAAWGALWADFDNDGWLDLAVANFAGVNPLYRNRGDGTFENVAPAFGMRDADDAMGMSVADFNNDGYMDIFVNNIMSSFSLYVNHAGSGFSKVTSDANMDSKDYSSHGSAWSDVNNDGAPDLYIVNNISPNFLYMNKPYPGTHYLQVKLEGKKSNAAGLGARVEVQAGEMKMIREVTGAQGYISQNSFTLHFGLGKATKVDKLTIMWPSGMKQVMEDVEADQKLTVTEKTD